MYMRYYGIKLNIAGNSNKLKNKNHTVEKLENLIAKQLKGTTLIPLAHIFMAYYISTSYGNTTRIANIQKAFQIESANCQCSWSLGSSDA